MTGETERFNQIRDNSGLSKKDFAKSLGLSLAMAYQISSGRARLPRDLLERLAAVHSVNLHWFVTGTGHSGIETDTVEIELYNQQAAAGHGSEVDGYIEKQTVPMLYDFLRPHDPKNLIAVYVSGDSMIGEHIFDGDIVIFNNKLKEGNGLYVVSVGNTLLVKRVDIDPANQTFKLISANPAYEARSYSGNELEDIRLEGRVVAWYHRV